MPDPTPVTPDGLSDADLAAKARAAFPNFHAGPWASDDTAVASWLRANRPGIAARLAGRGASLQTQAPAWQADAAAGVRPTGASDYASGFGRGLSQYLAELTSGSSMVPFGTVGHQQPQPLTPGPAAGEVARYAGNELLSGVKSVVASPVTGAVGAVQTLRHPGAAAAVLKGAAEHPIDQGLDLLSPDAVGGTLGAAFTPKFYGATVGKPLVATARAIARDPKLAGAVGGIAGAALLPGGHEFIKYMIARAMLGGAMGAGASKGLRALGVGDEDLQSAMSANGQLRRQLLAQGMPADAVDELAKEADTATKAAAAKGLSPGTAAEQMLIRAGYPPEALAAWRAKYATSGPTGIDLDAELARLGIPADKVKGVTPVTAAPRVSETGTVQGAPSRPVPQTPPDQPPPYAADNAETAANVQQRIESGTLQPGRVEEQLFKKKPNGDPREPDVTGAPTNGVRPTATRTSPATSDAFQRAAGNGGSAPAPKPHVTWQQAAVNRDSTGKLLPDELTSKVDDTLSKLRRLYGGDRIGKNVNPDAPEPVVGAVVRNDKKPSAMPDLAQQALLEDLTEQIAAGKKDPFLAASKAKPNTADAIHQLLKEYTRNGGPAASPVAKQVYELLQKYGYIKP